MTAEAKGRTYLAGGGDGLLESLQDQLGRKVERGFPERAIPGDIVFLDASGAADEQRMPWGNAFAACRTLKQDTAVRVFLLVRDGDPYSAEIARFCLADGSLRILADGTLADVEIVEARLRPRRPRVSVEELLDSLQEGIAEDEERGASALLKMLDPEREETLLEQLTDPETGLFDGPFAIFKLDEEFKRAQRFHQPLSLILIDCGVETWPADDAERRGALAEFASVFLNECRDIDILARFTERVFLCLLPGTGPDGAETVARRMLGGLRARSAEAGIELRPAAGLVTVPRPGIDHRSELLAVAEDCLERAQAGEGFAQPGAAP